MLVYCCCSSTAYSLVRYSVLHLLIIISGKGIQLRPDRIILTLCNAIGFGSHISQHLNRKPTSADDALWWSNLGSCNEYSGYIVNLRQNTNLFNQTHSSVHFPMQLNTQIVANKNFSPYLPNSRCGTTTFSANSSVKSHFSIAYLSGVDNRKVQ